MNKLMTCLLYKKTTLVCIYNYSFCMRQK